MLKLVDINKIYKAQDYSVHALKDINIDFRENEFVSILGPSGCGKTTLLNIIGGLDHYTSGDLVIKGKSTKDFRDRDWDAYRNHSVGFVFQSYNLIPHLNVERNVELALTISGMSKKERRQKAIDALTRVGLGEQLKKYPNQLSGGQMQRVAIARAIVNDPEILLADEPTGALDTETSVQILDLIKEISAERLVIMVTHNPDLAKTYSTRIINLLDGQITNDSNPYISQSEKSTKEEKVDSSVEIIEDSTKDKEKKKKHKKPKTSMSFFTALSLSFRNLLAKKGRTILTAIAGSIGIMSIALVLALSNGFNLYIDKMQTDTLSTYPLTVSEETVDLSSLMDLVNINSNDLTMYPTAKKVFVNDVATRLTSAMVKSSKITDKYVSDVIETIDPDLYYDIVYYHGLELEDYIYMYNQESDSYTILPSKLLAQSPQNPLFPMMSSQSISYRLSSNEDFVRSQYDVIEGKYPTDKSEIVLIVDKYNRISDLTLGMLGIRTTGDESTEYDFEDIMSTKYLLTTNNSRYVKASEKGYNSKVFIPSSIVSGENYVELKIVGILRSNEDTQTSLYQSGIAYTNDLYEYLLEQNLKSDIVKTAKDNPTINPITGDSYSDMVDGESTQEYMTTLRTLGGVSTPNDIHIFAKDFDTKSQIRAHLDEYNNSVTDENDKVYYNDVMQVMADTLSTMVDAISYVLIAFTSISLVVSSMMIGIITYVSVIERTREIGVLRSIGARKKDISRVFNAETFIIGLSAGTLGVVVAYILTIPINLLLKSLVEGIGNLANLNIFSALILVLISVVLTIISGLIPSKIASKKDPVEALRSE